MNILPNIKGALLGTPNSELQEYSRNILGIYLPGSFYSILFYSIPTIFLGFPVWSSQENTFKHVIVPHLGVGINRGLGGCYYGRGSTLKPPDMINTTKTSVLKKRTISRESRNMEKEFILTTMGILAALSLVKNRSPVHSLANLVSMSCSIFFLR